MRERDEVKMAVRHYKFVVIRVRMPDGLIVQGKVWSSVNQYSILCEHRQYWLVDNVTRAYNIKCLSLWKVLC